MVRAQQADGHDRDLRGHERKYGRVPPPQGRALEPEVRRLAPRQHAARVARLAHGRLDERREVPAAVQHVLHAQAAREPERLAPLLVELALEVERAPLVRDVARRDEQREARPGEHAVEREERAVVEQDAGPPDERGEHAERGRERGDDELGLVPDAHDVRLAPDVEPQREADDQPRDGIHCELRAAAERCRMNTPGPIPDDTYHQVGHEQRPFESVPASLGPCAPAFAGVEGHAVVVVVSFAGHAGLIAPERFPPSAALGQGGLRGLPDLAPLRAPREHSIREL